LIRRAVELEGVFVAVVHAHRGDLRLLAIAAEESKGHQGDYFFTTISERALHRRDVIELRPAS